jgi:proline iminopeptidase
MSNALHRTVPLPLLLLLACAHTGPSQGPSVEEGFVTTQDGARLWYQKRGSGSQVVVVPGAFLLQPDFDRLAQGRTVVLYDPRNRARSSPVLDEARISIQADVEDLETVRAHFGAERIIPVGWSYLGMMVGLYAEAHPDRVERLVQLGPTSPVPGTKYPPPLSMPNETLAPEVKQLHDRVEEARATEAARNPAEFCRINLRFLRRLLVNDPSRADRFPDQCGWEREWPTNLDRHFQLIWRSIFQTSVTRATAATVKVPVLVVHGRRDRNAPYGGGRDWAAIWPDARLVTLDEAAHALWIDDPTALDDLDTFLKGSWPARAKRITDQTGGSGSGSPHNRDDSKS